MAVLGQAQVTLTDLTDISALTIYYYQQTSTLAAPAKPTVKTPTGWVTTEPSVDTTKSLYSSTRTDWSNGEFTWSDVSLSSSYEAAKAAYNKATTAQATADTAAAAASANSTDLTNYITSNTTELSQMQSQIDGSIATWFYEVAPTADNAPTKDWTTTDLKNNHLGDLYYDTITGYCYRYQVVNNVYSWSRITDTDVTKALSDAAKAQDTADNKRRVFVTTPTPPYDIGDQWVQGSAGDILICSTAKTNGQTYVASDWTKASKYTDDTKANAAQSTADTAKTNAATAQATADGISVGGRNLLRDTTAFGASGVTSSDSGYLRYHSASGETYDGFTSRVITSSDVQYTVLCDYQITGCKNSETYTASFWAKGSSQIAVYFYGPTGYIPTTRGDGRTYITPTSDWTRYHVTWTLAASGGTTDVKYLKIQNDSASSTFSVCGVKLERGNRATDWTPAPEDTSASITESKNIATSAYQRASYLYGTCATEAMTVAKVATVTNFPSLYTGATCAIKFTYANNIDSPTLNVSSTGAKPIFAYGAALTIASGYSWTDNSTVSFVYDGTNWVMVDPGSLDKANEANSIANSAIDTANGAQTAANTANDAATAAATAAQTAQNSADAASAGVTAANGKITDLTSTTDTLRQNVKDLTDDSVTWNNLSKNVRVSDDLIVIGVPPQNGQIAGDVLSLELSSGKISFLKGSNEVAYVSGDKLYINSGVFVTSLRIGNFEFVPRSNGNMSFKKVG